MTVCLSPNGANMYGESSPPRRLLVGTVDGVVALERPRPGAPWQRAGRALEGCHIACLMLEPRHGGVFAGVHGSGLHLSRDDGQSWEPCMHGLAHEHVFALASVEREGKVRLHAGTAPPHLYLSEDYGETWNELPALREVPGRARWTFGPDNLAHVKHIAFDPRDARTLWLCVEQGALLKSTDAGRSWQEHDGFYDEASFKFYKDVHRVLFDPSDADVLYVTGGDGLMRSPDGGASWQRLTTRDMRIGYPDALFFSPADPCVLYMAGAASFPGSWRDTHTANAAVMRSRDRGATWETIHAGLPAHLLNNVEAMSMTTWPGGFGFFIATLDGSVYLSENAGESWQPIADGLPLVAKAHHARYLQIS